MEFHHSMGRIVYQLDSSIFLLEVLFIIMSMKVRGSTIRAIFTTVVAAISSLEVISCRENE